MSFRTACIFLLLAEANAQVMTERDAVSVFLSESPQARELRAGVEAVEAETRGWSLWSNPDASYSREGASVNQFWQIEQRLPLSGRLGYLRQAGGAAVSAAQSQSAFQRWQGISAVRAAFYDVVAAQEREKVIRANLDRLAEITRILSEREKQGEGSTYDRLRAERERAEIETELLSSRVAIAQARSRLAALLRPNTEPELDVNLKMQDRSKQQVLEDIRRRVSILPGMNVTIGQPISHRIDHMLSGTRANIAVKIFGDDLTTLRALAKQVQTVVQTVPGAVDVSTEQQMEIPTVRVRYDRAALARYGLGAGAAAQALQTAFVGQQVGEILEGQVSFQLVVRYDAEGIRDLDTIRQTQIDTPSGARIPLAAVAEIHEDRGPNFISRENVQRKIVVQCNVAGRDLRGLVNDIQKQVQAQVPLPSGYHIEYGGQFESEARASERLLWLGVAVIAGIFVILTAAFRSSRDALIIMLNLPLALIVGAIGVFVAGGVLSVASIIGFITLFGVATRNGIMLVSHVKHLMSAEGVTDLREAVRRGATERLAPIFMTAMAAGLALVPVALGLGKPGSEIQAPMPIVILFGLFSSTALNMVVVPAVYARFGRRVVTT